MTSDGNLPADQRRNYKSVFDALIRIFREEGITALWRGAIPTMGRAMVVNAAQLASYSQAKQGIMSTGYVDEGIFCHFLAYVQRPRNHCSLHACGYCKNSNSEPKVYRWKTRI